MHGDLSEAARLLAARRAVGPVVCEECGIEFKATSRRRYCSNTCNVRAWRRRKAEAAATLALAQTRGTVRQPVNGRIRALPGAQSAPSDLPGDHTALWWQSQVAIANLRAALARLQGAADRGVPRRLRITDFAAAGEVLQAALARQDAAAYTQRSNLAAARARLEVRDRATGSGVAIAPPAKG
jgi:hypothetical protein